jgi:hypothetical protein
MKERISVLTCLLLLLSVAAISAGAQTASPTPQTATPPAQTASPTPQTATPPAQTATPAPDGYAAGADRNAHAAEYESE